MRLTDEQLATELRALREEPSERFAAELDAWAAAGFPARQPEPAKQPRRRPLVWRRLVPAFGAAAATVVVIAVAISVSGQDTESLDSAPGDDEAPSFAAPEAGDRSSGEPGTEAAPSTVAPAPPAPGEQLRPGRERIQERSASLSLSTEPGEVDEVSDGVVDVTDRYDGIVVSSQVSTSDGTGRASFDLRIPTQNLQAALADLSDLAHVASRDEGTLDITAPFVGAEERFGDAKAEVDALLDQLAAADSANEVAAIREQLRIARAELAVARSQLAGLKQRADFARLGVTVIGNGDGDGWSIGDAAGDAVDVLEALGGAGLIALAVVVPLGAIGVAGWLGTRELRRRRREAPLDQN